MTPPDRPPSESREMFTEISGLVASLAKALGLSETDTAAAVERGEVQFSFDRDANGNPFVAVRYGTATARLYQGAIKRETDGK